MAIPTTAERARRKPAWATLAGNVALALLALVVALFLAELMVRLTGFSYTVYIWTDPVRGMAHIPGAKSVRQSNGRPWVEINSDGLAGTGGRRSNAAPGYVSASRSLGDSYIEAFEVSVRRRRSAKLLEARLVGPARDARSRC